MSSMLLPPSGSKGTMTIGERVTQAREAANLSRAELGRRVGISRSAISQIENGTTKSPSAENLEKIADATSVPTKWLLSGKGPIHPQTDHKQSPVSTGSVKESDIPASHTGDVREVLMSPQELELLEAFRELDDEIRARIVTKVQARAFKVSKAGRSFTDRQTG